jgi:ribosomal-protein-alanine N-acetyltransferase
MARLNIESSRLYALNWNVEMTPYLDLIEQDPGFKSYCYPPSYDFSNHELKMKFILNKINLQNTHGSCKNPVFTKSGDEFIGLIGLEPFKFENNDYFEIGFRLLEKYWGNGYALEFTKALLDEFKLRRPEVSISALAHIGNFTSQKCLNKLGFKPVKEFLHNEEIHIWYSLKNKIEEVLYPIVD